MRGVSVASGNDVFVGISVSATVGGMGVDVSVQVNDVRIYSVRKNVFRLINKLSFQDTIPDRRKNLRGSYKEIKIPVSNGDCECGLSGETTSLILYLAISA
jgi:hypothetical protein